MITFVKRQAMKERLSVIIRHYNISSSRLAEKLGVQRSGISHILSGRNNPGYDFLVGLLETFPEINAEWLLTGRGNMLKTSADSFSGESGNQVAPAPGLEKELFPSKQDKPSNISSEAPPEFLKSEDAPEYGAVKKEHADEEVEKVIVLYKNGRFSSYSPG